MACEWWGEHNEEWERDVNESNDKENGVAKLFDVGNVQLRNAQDRNNLLPPKACMNHEDRNTEDVEAGPNPILEELMLQRIDVAYAHGVDAVVIGPEQIEGKNSPKIDPH